MLGGSLSRDTRFAPGDWRAKSTVFRGEVFEHNLQRVDELAEFARRDLGISIGQLAVAWTLANPAVDVAIVGTRNPLHIREALEAVDVTLHDDTMGRIDEILRDTTSILGPSPETV
jgi:hypothetical protein